MSVALAALREIERECGPYADDPTTEASSSVFVRSAVHAGRVAREALAAIEGRLRVAADTIGGNK